MFYPMYVVYAYTTGGLADLYSVYVLYVQCVYISLLTIWYFMLLIPDIFLLLLLLLLLLVFSPWAGLGRDQGSVRRMV